VYIGFERSSAGLVVGDGIGLGEGDSPFGETGLETTFASKASALVGLPEPESLRVTMGACVLRHGEETVDGVNGGRRLPDLCC
jgi:hypothetical protein